MFPLHNIREHVTNKLETDVKVFYKFKDSSRVIRIEESGSNAKGTRQDLVLVKLTNIPYESVWIFENEFSQNKYPNSILDGQKGAFSSAGNKVEKTIVWHYRDKLYLFLFEMKRTMTYDNFAKIKEKVESSLSTISIFIAGHEVLPSFADSNIFPIVLCCFNHEDFAKGYSGDSETRTLLRTKYVDGHQAQFLMKIEPLTLNRFMIPVLLFKNPNDPITTGFEINLNDILERVNSVLQ